MRKGEGPTYAELAVKLKELRTGRAELDRLIENILDLLPADATKLDQPVRGWNEKIKPALERAKRHIDRGIGHPIIPVRC